MTCNAISPKPTVVFEWDHFDTPPPGQGRPYALGLDAASVAELVSLERNKCRVFCTDEHQRRNLPSAGVPGATE